MDWKQRTYCGTITRSQKGETVRLMGWVDAIRDHGSLLFIHLRDVQGIVQVVFDPAISPEGYPLAATLREEDVISIEGTVSIRKKGTENPHIRTADTEIYATTLKILSRAKTLPFPLSEKAMVLGEEITASPQKVDEDLRITYRYLDLRRPSVQDLFKKRYEITKTIRDFLHELHFMEVETPILTRSTPEGARDYLVPSRVHQGKFYALPQSPQIFKQLLMIGGMDRYFQIARCFRDEDLRPNRQPEFTQLDLEASFIDEEFIYETLEELTCRCFSIGGKTLSRPFPRMTYEEAMNRYGSDRPDTRFDMAFEDLSDVMRETGYAVFKQIIAKHGVVKGFCVRGKASAMSKNLLQNEYALRIVPSFGARGMTWMKVLDGRLQSNIVQFFSDAEQEAIIDRFQAGDGDVILLIADTSPDLVNTVLGRLRLHVAERFDIIPEDIYRPLWITKFPLFELKDGLLGSEHHPFTMPDRDDFDPEDMEALLALKSRAYDLVMNGEELGGGSIRIHQTAIQEKIFRALRLSRAEIDAKFGFFLRALEFGTPPHGGFALGLDRAIAMILDTPSIREVIAFPKNRRAYCPLTHAPATVDEAQLKELGLGIAGMQTASPGSAEGSAGDESLNGAKIPRVEVTSEEVRHVAKLARLTLSEGEVDEYAKDLTAILDYVAKLDELETDTVSPTSHVLEIRNVWRDDNPGTPAAAPMILENAPKREKDFFQVPKILEG
ncbi:MAG: Asp-tRNA(Asn)/Glu-tRNA(Gln) amidotransferase GatCAB subunit C [Deltaproteobacteria bacterium]|nr:MAG: Asp-tRNA(Asn)/Glu-tRNA(Gln) amidotransferase GatCAB subunit C [Deltaproteobacteria bacterium]